MLPDLKILEEEGILIDIPGIGFKRIFAFFAQFTGDNIEINEAFGLITCFTADCVCPFCYGTKEEFQLFFRESQFELRTLDEYNRDILQLSDLPIGGHHSGVKNMCELNNLKHWKSVQNWTNDSFHTVLQGMANDVIGCVLFGLNDDDVVNLEQVNQRITFFSAFFVVDKKINLAV